MRTRLSPIILLLATALEWAHPASAAIYHVALSGSDANSGSAAAPWRHLQHAADQAMAGDTVIVHGGVYLEALQSRRDGTAAALVSFVAAENERPIIDGTGQTDGVPGVLLVHSHIKLSGFEVRNWASVGGVGIQVARAGFFEIADCEIHHCVFGVSLVDGCHDFVFNRVTSHHCGTPDGDTYCFDMSPGAPGAAPNHHGTFNDCVAHTGIRPTGNENVDGFAIGHGGQHQFWFNRCTTYGVFDGFDIGQTSADVTLTGCTAHSCNGGYKLWGNRVVMVNCLAHDSNTNVELDWSGTPATKSLINCTLFNAVVYNIWVEDARDSLRLYNCIVAGGENIGLCFEQRSSANYRGDGNIFHNTNADRAISVGYMDEFSLEAISAGNWTTSTGQDGHSIVITAPESLFLGLADRNFRLRPFSPAIEAGQTVTGMPADDFAGTTRRLPNDVGAFEYEAPALKIARKADGSLRLTWPAWAAGWQLQQSATPSSWNPAIGQPVANGPELFLDFTPQAPRGFFRLRYGQ